MGIGSTIDVLNSRKWRNSKEFTDVCVLSDWNPEWIESIFMAFEELHRRQPDLIRIKLTGDYVSLLRSNAREN